MQPRCTIHASAIWLKSLAIILLLTLAAQQWVQLDAGWSRADIEWEMDGEEGEEFESESDDPWIGHDLVWHSHLHSLMTFRFWFDQSALQALPDEVHTPPPEMRG